MAVSTARKLLTPSSRTKSSNSNLWLKITLLHHRKETRLAQPLDNRFVWSPTS